MLTTVVTVLYILCYKQTQEYAHSEKRRSRYSLLSVHDKHIHNIVAR
jgi:hypothetical protein